MNTTATVNWNKGKVAEKHNEREEDLCKNESHIDLYNEHGNSYHEVWYRSDLHDKYAEVFGEAIDAYNAKQKRKDRRMTVDDYMQSVLDDTRGKRQTKKVNGKKVVDMDARHGKQLEYEITVKVGNTERQKDANGRTQYDGNGHHVRLEYLPRDLQKKVLQRYAETFQSENPNFIVTNIDFHADEGFYNQKGEWEYSCDHPHIRFIPVAHGFKQGLSVQNSMNKALAEMGFTDNCCYENWAKKEQGRLEKILLEEYQSYCNDNPQFYNEHGDLNVTHPVRDKTKQGGKSKEQYSAEQELDEKIHETEYLKKVIDGTAKKIHEREQSLNDRETELDSREKCQKAHEAILTQKESELHSERQKLLREASERSEELDRRSEELDRRESAVRVGERVLAEKQADFTAQVDKAVARRQNASAVAESASRRPLPKQLNDGFSL